MDTPTHKPSYTKTEFRRYLNDKFGQDPANWNYPGRLGATTSLFGDYLYREDKDKFNAEYFQWLIDAGFSEDQANKKAFGSYVFYERLLAQGCSDDEASTRAFFTKH